MKTIQLSKPYSMTKLKVARLCFDQFVKNWNEGSKGSVYHLLNDGFRATAYIRFKKQDGQTESDAVQILNAWLEEVDNTLRQEIIQKRKQELDDYISSQIGQMFPAREVKFGSCIEELDEVSDDSEIE